MNISSISAASSGIYSISLSEGEVGQEVEQLKYQITLLQTKANGINQDDADSEAKQQRIGVIQIQIQQLQVQIQHVQSRQNKQTDKSSDTEEKIKKATFDENAASNNSLDLHT